MAEYVVLNLKQATAWGLLTCACGHAENTHFTWDERSAACAHCECKNYRMRTKPGAGKIIEVDAITEDDLVLSIQNDAIRAIKETG